ncbi:hypothetical protein [Metabacillus litoralis]|uniref:hypothetical protein n=1 Tax=Metabacillus litoralis TaxID=152268 RepID=UPI00131595BA|nr:hypothetical protein [Metabacillus litoralis]
MTIKNSEETKYKPLVLSHQPIQFETSPSYCNNGNKTDKNPNSNGCGWGPPNTRG